MSPASSAIHDPASVSLLAQADLLLLLADALRCPAQAGSRLEAVQLSDLDALVRAAGLSDRAELLHSLQAACLSWQQLDVGAWADEYHRLFEGAMACPMNETAFVRREKGVVIGDLAGYYRAFGWLPATQAGEKPDHLTTELEFMAVLLAMTAQAHAEQNAAAAEITRAAAASFASQHAGDWIPALCEHLHVSTPLPFYRNIARVLSLVWNAMVAIHGWTVTPLPAADFAIADTEESPCVFACGRGSGLP